MVFHYAAHDGDLMRRFNVYEQLYYRVNLTQYSQKLDRDSLELKYVFSYFYLDWFLCKRLQFYRCRAARAAQTPVTSEGESLSSSRF